ncbi:MAG: type II toxin-antitoxin system VapC family toxin [Trichlorobacter sp.]|jgi:PIN domain nuclease of toxin-antitoxin system|nr:type II toxin-antitoxin system VapC family toxin [Trichlorobacter sp.]
MKLLLDTHIALWAISDDSRLSGHARYLITSPDNHVFVSAASVWEISIKYSLARSNMPISGAEALGYFKQSGYQLLPITPEHTVIVEQLPLLHSDPFDRILLAQALHEPLRLITHDATVASYNETVILV